MAAKTKTPKKPAVQGLQTVRPGEVVVLSDEDILIGASWLNPVGTTRNYALGVRAGVPTIIETRALEARSDGATQLRAGRFEVIDATEGALAEVVDVSDNRARAIFRDGKPAAPPKNQRIQNWRGTLGEWSLADCVVTCLDTMGLPDDMQDPRTEALVRDLVETYGRSFENRTSRSQPWITRSQELIAIHRAREAGLVPAQPAQGGAD